MTIGPHNSASKGQQSDTISYNDGQAGGLASSSGLRYSPSNHGSFASHDLGYNTSIPGSSSSGDLQNPQIPGTNTYTNRAANKTSTALIRFGKAIYGGGSSQNPLPPLSGATVPASRNSSATDKPFRPNSIQHVARSEIIAMGPSSTENAVAIVGKDCK